MWDMWEGAEILEVLLRGVALGALLTTAIALGRGGPTRAIRLSSILLCVTIAGYAMISSPLTRDASGSMVPVFRFLSSGGVGAIWAFVLALFADRRATPLLFAPFAGLLLFSVVAWLTPPAVQPGLWVAHNLIEAGLAVHILLVVGRSWRGDLVEARRRLRGPFMAAVALFAVVVSIFEIGESFGVEAAWYPLAGAAALAAFCLAGVLVMLEVRTALFGAAAARDPVLVEVTEGDPAGPNAAELLELSRLTALMDEGEAWRRESLSIGVLADELKIPEHRLRRLINDHLGYRNFAAFVNSHRIEAAKRRLSDPAEARKTVSAIAFDLGFGSLGPFNRAFREATGQTPTEWRRSVLAANPGGED